MDDHGRINNLIEDIKFNLEETLTKLEEIWVNIGLKDELKEGRCETVRQHVHDLLHEMLSEEYALEAKLELKVKEVRKNFFVPRCVCASVCVCVCVCV
jgi:hypothetical protein